MHSGTPFAAHVLSKGLAKFELRASRTALTWTGLVLGLLACVLVFALRLGLLFVRSDSWPAYVLLGMVALSLLILLTEVNYFGRAWYFTLLYAASAVMLTATGWWWGHTADVLQIRGRWSEVRVAEVIERPRRQTLCQLQHTKDGTRVLRALDDCAHLAVGDTLKVFEDPEGEVRPELSAPSVSGAYVASGIEASILVAAVTCAFWAGGRWRDHAAPPPYPTQPYPGQYPGPSPGPFDGPYSGAPGQH
ncbi:hypothetical protein ACF09J_21110 [Streptomyces sp. NPDC014889]|uniref:hypothetical protein n=1 Tax=Streptomyces sp. NPDC014889 TaxID=3364928 RepID=UPI0036FA90AC